jgi:SCY1-like protein 2
MIADTFLDVLPIIFNALESPTPSLVDAALRSLPSVLPQLDFSTIKNELFPVIAAIFSKTNSLAIKVRGLQAFVTLCGGSNDPGGNDGLDGLGPQKKATTSTALDKFTMQEKIVPLIKVIKTKEPAVMIAALNVLRVVGQVADADFVAVEILPILWSMSLGPLLDLKQFQSFMELIKSLSNRVEEEQTRKLQELAGGSGSSSAMKDDFMSFGPVAGSSFDANGASETDFESLVKGGPGGLSSNTMDSGWDSVTSSAAVTSPTVSSSRNSTPTPAFSWSTAPAAPAAAPANKMGAVKAQQPGFRTVTPDLTSFQPITPTTTQFSQPLQPAQKPAGVASAPLTPQAPSINWGTATAPSNNSNLWSSPPAAQQPPTSAFGSLSLGQQSQQTQNRTPTFSLPPPPSTSTNTTTSSFSGFSLAPPPGASQAQPPRPPITTTSSTPAFGGLGGMTSMNSSSMSSLASMGAAANKMGSNSGSGMGMGMGMAAMKNMNASTGMGNGPSMNSMTGMGMGMGMGAAGLVQQQQSQWQGQNQNQGQGQGQGQKSGLDKYESLL